MRLALIIASMLTATCAEAAELTFEGSAFAWQPVTISADLGCSEFVGISSEAGVIRIDARSPAVAGCNIDAQPRAITIGSFPQGTQLVDLYYDGRKVQRLEVAIAASGVSADAPAFSIDGWWSADRGNGNGLLLQRGPDGRLYGSLLTYDAQGTPTFLIFQGWSWVSESVGYAGPIYRTRGSAFDATTTLPVDSVRVGDGNLAFESLQCFVAPCELNPDRLRFTMRIGGGEQVASFNRLQLPRQ